MEHTRWNIFSLPTAWVLFWVLGVSETFLLDVFFFFFNIVSLRKSSWEQAHHKAQLNKRRQNTHRDHGNGSDLHLGVGAVGVVFVAGRQKVVWTWLWEPAEWAWGKINIQQLFKASGGMIANWERLLHDTCWCVGISLRDKWLRELWDSAASDFPVMRIHDPIVVCLLIGTGVPQSCNPGQLKLLYL